MKKLSQKQWNAIAYPCPEYNAGLSILLCQTESPILIYLPLYKMVTFLDDKGVQVLKRESS